MYHSPGCQERNNRQAECLAPSCLSVALKDYADFFAMSPDEIIAYTDSLLTVLPEVKSDDECIAIMSTIQKAIYTYPETVDRFFAKPYEAASRVELLDGPALYARFCSDGLFLPGGNYMQEGYIAARYYQWSREGYVPDNLRNYAADARHNHRTRKYPRR